MAVCVSLQGEDLEPIPTASAHTLSRSPAKAGNAVIARSHRKTTDYSLLLGGA